MEITSVNNELVKNTVKLQQKKYRNVEKNFCLKDTRQSGKRLMLISR